MREEKLLTYREVADLLSVSTATVARLVKTGELRKVIQPPNHPRVLVSSLDSFLEGKLKKARFEARWKRIKHRLKLLWQRLPRWN